MWVVLVGRSAKAGVAERAGSGDMRTPVVRCLFGSLFPEYIPKIGRVKKGPLAFGERVRG
jgi:hypothetical protein